MDSRLHGNDEQYKRRGELDACYGVFVSAAYALWLGLNDKP